MADQDAIARVRRIAALPPLPGEHWIGVGHDDLKGTVARLEEAERIVTWLTERLVCVGSHEGGHPLADVAVRDPVWRLMFLCAAHAGPLPRAGVEYIDLAAFAGRAPTDVEALLKSDPRWQALARQRGGQRWCAPGDHPMPPGAVVYGAGDGGRDGRDGRFSCAEHRGG